MFASATRASSRNRSSTSCAMRSSCRAAPSHAAGGRRRARRPILRGGRARKLAPKPTTRLVSPARSLLHRRPTRAASTPADPASGQTGPVATIARHPTAVATIAGQLAAVATIAGQLAAVATIAGQLAAVATIAGQLAAVATIAGQLAAVATIAGQLAAVATIAGQLAAVATIAPNLVASVPDARRGRRSERALAAEIADLTPGLARRLATRRGRLVPIAPLENAARVGRRASGARRVAARD